MSGFASFFTNKNTKTSDFFKGINIFEILKNGNFGKFQKTLEDMFGKDAAKEYILPRVVVIGNESSGKSCLLENITKCQLFPRDMSAPCTKCPIKLNLNPNENKECSLIFRGKKQTFKKKEDVYKEVSKLMKELGNGQIIEDEITININEKNVPKFEFYDLPGIVTYPEDMAQKTLNLTKKYLQQEHTIVLCVVPATVTRLTSCQSIGLVKQLGLEKRTILALTMADRLEVSTIPDLLINRLLQTTEEIKEINFYDIVSVVNRRHNDKYSLDENDTHEKKWFNENIFSKLNSEKYKKMSDNLVLKTTILHMVYKLGQLYDEHIDKEWKPTILKKITEKINKLQGELDMLGTPVSNLNKESTTEMIKIDVRKIFYSTISTHKYNFFSENLKRENYETDYTIHATKYNHFMEQLDNLTHENINFNIFIKIFSNNLSAYFSKEKPLVLDRFDNIKKYIIDSIEYYLVDYFNKNQSLITTSLINYISEKGMTNSLNIIELNNCLINLLLMNIFIKVYEDFYKLITIKEHMYSENKYYHNQRISLNKQITQAQQHYSQIKNLNVGDTFKNTYFKKKQESEPNNNKINYSSKVKV